MEFGLRGRSRIELTRVRVRGIGNGIGIGSSSIRSIGRSGIRGARARGAGGARVLHDPLPAQPLVVLVGRPLHHGRAVYRVHDAG
jgi:hypothetical protein